MLKLVRNVVIVLAIGGVLVWAMLPQPISVEVQAIDEGPLRVTVDEDGKTRIKDRYIVSAPLGGKLHRVDLLPGDDVLAGRTVLATMEPTAPRFLDARTIAESAARVKSAKAAVASAEVAIESAKLTLDNAKRRYDRASGLANSQAITPEALEEAETQYRLAEEAHRAAVFAARIAEYEVELAEAAQAQTTDNGSPAAEDSSGVPGSGAEEPAEEEPVVTESQFRILSPIDGVVLEVFQKSAKIVVPGEDLLEVGNPIDLELEIDVLSKDAVRIRAGDEIEVIGWGGERPLRARVRLVEPSAFTQISALGVEEQRVNVIADFVGGLDEREGLGDNYRVEASIIVWQRENVVRVPTSALFRDGKDWGVFVVRDGRAQRQPLKIGQRNSDYAQVLDGVNPGDRVIVHPSDKIDDGAHVAF